MNSTQDLSVRFLGVHDGPSMLFNSLHVAVFFGAYVLPLSGFRTAVLIGIRVLGCDVHDVLDGTIAVLRDANT